jgi:predicted transcriptional regulator
MAYMKTAISIDEDLFNKAEKLSERLHVSRSQLFAQALEYLIQKNESLEIIKKLNDLYNDPEILDEQKSLSALSKKRLKGIVEKW